MAASVCRNDQTLAVIGELNLGPVDLLASHEALLHVEDVECCKGRLVVVAHIVEEDVLCRW